MIQKGDSGYKKFIDACFMEVKRVLRSYSDKLLKKTYMQHQHAVAILLMKLRENVQRCCWTAKGILDILWVQQVDTTLYHFGEVFHMDTNVRLGLLAPKTYELFAGTIADVAMT